MQYPKALQKHDTHMWEHDIFWVGEKLEYIKPYAQRIERILKMHAHRFYEMNIITAGTGRHYIGGETYDVKRGSVCIIPPDTAHGYYTFEGLDVYHILMNHAFFQHYRHELNHVPGYSLMFELAPYLNRYFSLTLDEEQLAAVTAELQGLDEAERDSYGGKEVLKNAKLTYLIGLLSKYTFADGALEEGQRVDRHLLKTVEYIHSHYAEKLRTQELAELANVSASAYLRKFKALMGCSPAQYQMNCRIDRARELLQGADMSLTQIAYDCGFYDSSHFIRTFVQKTGISPLRFRKEGTR